MPGNNAMRWDRLLWGIAFYSSMERERPSLLGATWEPSRSRFDSEPARTLLFRSRKEARDWCKVQHDKYQPRNDSLSRWRFRPVRVRETVKPSGEGRG